MPPRSKDKAIKRNDRGEDEDGERDQRQPTIPSSSLSTRKRSSRTRISAACDACKKRKTKCTGEPLPCYLCEVLGTECVIDLAQDMRRREAMQQTLNESKSFEEALNGLVDCVRDGNPESIESLRQAFRRDGVTRQDIWNTIQYWAQIVRSRSTMTVRQELSVETASASQMTVGGNLQTERWPLDPLLRDDFAFDVDSASYFSALHRRLKDCSENDGVRILRSLVNASSIADFEEEGIQGVDGWMDGLSGPDIGFDMDIASTVMNYDLTTTYWRPPLQEHSDPSGTNAHPISFRNPSKPDVAGTSRPHAQVLPRGRAPGRQGS